MSRPEHEFPSDSLDPKRRRVDSSSDNKELAWSAFKNVLREKMGYFETFKDWLENNHGEVNMPDSRGLTTFLHAAVGIHVTRGGKQLELIKFLLEHGADPNNAILNDRTPLEIAALNNQDEVVRIILEKSKIPVNIFRRSESTDHDMAGRTLMEFLREGAVFDRLQKHKESFCEDDQEKMKIVADLRFIAVRSASSVNTLEMLRRLSGLTKDTQEFDSLLAKEVFLKDGKAIARGASDILRDCLEIPKFGYLEGVEVPERLKGACGLLKNAKALDLVLIKIEAPEGLVEKVLDARKGKVQKKDAFATGIAAQSGASSFSAPGTERYKEPHESIKKMIDKMEQLSLRSNVSKLIQEQEQEERGSTTGFETSALRRNPSTTVERSGRGMDEPPFGVRQDHGQSWKR